MALVILDGWGIGKNDSGNAVNYANTPYIDSLFVEYPNSQLLCFGESVGLPEGQMGNSEVGHLNLGAGRIIYQDITRINRVISQGGLVNNPVLANSFVQIKGDSVLHLMGLIGDGGVHSLQLHLYSIIRVAVQIGVKNIVIHAFLDGRDTNPTSGIGHLEDLLIFLKDYPVVKVATISGRFWAMDRDKRWDRIKLVWEAIVHGRGVMSINPLAAIREAYSRQEYDEFIRPIVFITNKGEIIGKVKDGDVVFFFNFRADRARELTWVFTQYDFEGFDIIHRPRLADYICMTQYDESLKNVKVVFPPQIISNGLAEVISSAGFRQLHIAETEKYAHVTFFFNGGREEPFFKEDRVLIKSLTEVFTYDQYPAMRAIEITNEVIKRVKTFLYDFIVVNYANGDMVGHTGNFSAACTAMEVLDFCMSRLIPVILQHGGSVILTSDHGNIEQMLDYIDGGVYTAHSVYNPVSVILINQSYKDTKLRQSGSLCDIAPTILYLMSIKQPYEMSGRCLI